MSCERTYTQPDVRHAAHSFRWKVTRHPISSLPALNVHANVLLVRSDDCAHVWVVKVNIFLFG